MPYDVEITQVQARPAAVARFTATESEMAEKIPAALDAVLRYVAESGAAPAGAVFAYYEQLGERGFDVRAGVVVDQPIEGNGDVRPFVLPNATVVTTTHIGPPEKLPDAYAALAEQAEELGAAIDLAVPMWEEYVSAPGTPPDQARTVIYWPVRLAAR